MPTFERSTSIDCERFALYQYHSMPGAINRLIPPWENIRIEKRSDSLAVGSEVILRQSLMGIPVRWLARHTLLDAPESFQDAQVTGPFKSWVHDHSFECSEPGRSILRDKIHFESKFGVLGALTHPFIRGKLNAAFEYRHRTTQEDLRLQRFLISHVGYRKLRIAVTGSTGMIGRRLVDLLSVLGHKAICILRPQSTFNQNDFPIGVTSVVWDSRSGFSSQELVNGLDAVIHLSGQGIATSRWSDSVKKSIRDSRVKGTKDLVRDLSDLASPPKAFVCASGVGYYGDRGSQILDESFPSGNDFLAELARDWESAAQEFEQSGNRVSIGRLGIALHPRYGALAKLITPFRLGLGGRVGSGRQYWSWIHLDDAAAGFIYLAVNPASAGPYNLVAPEQTDNQSFTRALAKALHRPAVLPIPAFAARLILGEMADAMLLASARANCGRLLTEGFPFRAPTLESCFHQILGVGSSQFG
jgi:uncharacterized protein (TIGR01777 family)